MLNSTMKDKASSQERAEIIKWVRMGSPEDMWDRDIQPIVHRNCISCHGGIQGLPNFTTYEGIKPEAKIDEGASIADLARVSHIHLFGISFIFFFVGLIFSLAIGLPAWLKATTIALPFAFLLVDILSWWLTKWYPTFAYATIVGGMLYNSAAAFMILTSLYQMWVMPLWGQRYGENAWTQIKTR